ncbi:polyphosphate polymerase domain-containing protein [Plantibacter flavus]|uniref:polyphosphate polymerase domain-containing protein n=1 Tax=Plantibacter flavus TaxID=150123 RepID=UPI003F14CD47
MSAAVLDDFAAISLTELVERASLQTRVDRKYVIPSTGLDQLLTVLAADGARILEIDGERDFAYESVYFDTPDLSSFRLAATGRRRRFKIRSRSYLDTGSSYLEVKTRGGRSSTVKERHELDPDDARVLTPCGREYVGEVLGDAGIRSVDPEELSPVLTTRYSRATLFVPSSESRATIDTRLVWELEDAGDHPTGGRLERPAISVVETKSGNRASAVDRILWSLGHRPSSISKYATGMAALHPELSANRWGRVLARDFDRPGGPTTASRPLLAA